MSATPVETVNEAFAALDRQDWRALARLFTTEWLATIRDQHLGMLGAMQAHSKAAKTGSGGGSLAAVQHPVGDFMQQFGSTRVRVFPGSPTVSDLASLSPEDFFVRWQEACTYASLPLRAYGAFWRLFHRETKEGGRLVLGSVTEGEDMAHVLYRQPGCVDPWRADVITLKRVEGSWRLQLDEVQWGMDPFRGGDIFLMGRAMMGPWYLLAGRAIVGSWIRSMRNALLRISGRRKGSSGKGTPER